MNYAVGKRAYQSTDHSSGLYNAPAAVDGNRNGDMKAKSCMHTASQEYYPWWAVDLGAYLLNEVVISNRVDAYGKLRLFCFMISDDIYSK